MDDIIRYFDGFQPDINSMILGALTLLIFILIVYLIIFSRNIAKAAKRANRTMENIEKISTITLKKSMQLDSASNDFIEAMSKVASAWGIPGALLSVPIASIIKIVCENIHSLRPIAVLMGSGEAALLASPPAGKEKKRPHPESNAAASKAAPETPKED